MTDRARPRCGVNAEDLIITPPGGTPPPVKELPPLRPEPVVDERAGDVD